MLLPSILPDELAHGFLGRIRAVNIYSSSQIATSALEAAFLKENGVCEKARRVKALARAAGLSLEMFCQQHTLMPFLRASTDIRPGILHGSSEHLAMIERSALRFSMPARVGCPKCIEEDMSYWGFAYWRRRHQLVGVPWCDKHHVSLFEVASDFDMCPSATQNGQNTWSQEEFDEIIGSPVIGRYVEISTGFLECRRPLSFSEAAKKLSLRAQELGIRVSKFGQRKNLSDVALECVPHAWLSSLLPGIETKKSGDRFPPLDRVVCHEGLPQARALALALLFDSAEEALQYWNEPQTEDAEDSTENSINGQDFWNSRKVFGAYVKSHGNRSEIGRLLNVHSRWVSRELDRSGLPSLAGHDYETTGRALAEYYNGRSLAEACEMYNADYSVCDKITREAGARFAEGLRRIMRMPKTKSNPWEIVKGRKKKQRSENAETEDFVGSTMEERWTEDEIPA